MKLKSLLTLFIFVSLASQAQQNNIFWQSDFWKQNPSVELVKSEIEKGNDAVNANPRGFDATTMAINSNAPTATIAYLLSLKGNGVNKLTHDSRIYLHWATARGNIDVIKLIIAKGADIRLKDSKGAEPIQFGIAAAAKNTAIFDLYFKAGLPVKTKFTNGANLLLLSVAYDENLSATNYLIGKGLSINSVDEFGSTAFDYAARSGNIDLLKKLVAKGVKPTSAALIYASELSRGGSATSIECFKYLVEDLKLNPNYVNHNGDNVLHSLVRKPKQDEIIKYFLAKGTDVNKANAEGVTPLMFAVAANQSELIQLLIDKVKNINSIDNEGFSALTYAVNSGSLGLIVYLIDKGADVKVIDKAGNNLAYHLVLNYREVKENDEFQSKLNVLQDKGLSINSSQKDGNTLLHVAVKKNDVNLLKKLNYLKIDVNAKNNEGITALHRAALLAKNTDILKYLVGLGADLKLKTEFGETAYDLAADNQFLTKEKVSLDFLKN